MIYSLFSVLGAILVLTIVGYRFYDFFKVHFPINLSPVKKCRILTIRIVAAILAIVIFYSIFTTLSKPYYKNPDYWLENSYYRNKKITKIWGTNASSEIIFGPWRTIEISSYGISENDEGYQVNEEIARQLMRNDSIITTEYLTGDLQKYEFFFDSKDRLSKIKILVDSTVLIHDFDYENGRLAEYSKFRNGSLTEKILTKFSDPYNIEILESDARGKIIQQKNIKCDRNGLPIHLTIKGEYRKPTIAQLLSEDPSTVQGDLVFDIIKEESYTYDGFVRKNDYQYRGNNNGKGTKILGLGLGLISEDLPLYNYKNEYVYDSYGNWLARIRIYNGMAYGVELRQITYQDGTLTGSIDPDTIRHLR